VMIPQRQIAEVLESQRGLLVLIHAARLEIVFP
jgi:hypothetical protein